LRPSIALGEESAPVGTTRIEPIGFSHRGQFAFARHKSDGFCGDCTSFQVANLITDKTEDIGGFDGEHVGLEQLKGELRGRVFAALDKHGIIRGHQIAMKKFPFELDGDKFNASIIREVRNDLKESGCVGDWETLTFKLTSGKMGQKDIVKFSRCSEDPGPVDTMHEVLGFFRSPFEKRIAIVTSGRRYVLEGEFEDQILLFGAHLGVGFNK